MNDDNYRDNGIPARLGILFRGLGKPQGTREYKLARLELQRLFAPLVALTAVSLTAVVLCVVTAVGARPAERPPVDVPPIEDVDSFEPDPDPIPPDDPVPTPPDEVPVTVDTPQLPSVTNLAPPPHPTPPSPDTTVKPAEVETVQNIKSPVMFRRLRTGPTPGGPGSITTGGGPGWGNNKTEAAVLKVLWWLKAKQNTDGSWGEANKVANTAFAVLSYLAHGEHPGSKSPYRKDFGPVVQQALDFLIGSLAADAGGVPRFRGSDGNEYSFLLGTYALCEAYGMTGNPNCKDAALTCLARIVSGQSATGGWDYKLNSASNRDDLSFAGWAIQALKAAKLSGLEVDGLDAALNKAIGCLKRRSASKSAGFTYTPTGGNNGGTTGLSGVGALALQFLGHGDEPEARNALEVMRAWQPAFDRATLSAGNSGACPQYYCYYATQCKYQAGMRPGAPEVDEKAWVAWNAAMQKLYTASIRDVAEKVPDHTGKGHAQGYYENADALTSRPYMDTCLVALQLMVYYRYLPTSHIEPAKGAEPARKAVAFAKDVEVTADI